MRMRKTSFILFFIFSLLFVQCNPGDRDLNQKLSEMTRELNESAPVMLDQFTRFEEAAVTSDNVFRYHYTVLHTTNPDSLLENRYQSLRESILTMLSTNADLRIFTENEVTMEYIYSDENQRVIRTIRINPEDYQ